MDWGEFEFLRHAYDSRAYAMTAPPENRQDGTATRLRRAVSAALNGDQSTDKLRMLMHLADSLDWTAEQVKIWEAIAERSPDKALRSEAKARLERALPVS